MINEHIEWYKTCLDSLLGSYKNEWIYSKVKLFSVMDSIDEVEEKIRDTKCRFRTLIDYASDIFTGDRMESKSYQLPFLIYDITSKMFDTSVAAVASEALMSIANWDYRVHSNLLRFIIFDENVQSAFVEKMTIFFMALEETKALEEKYMDDCRKMTLAEFYPLCGLEIENINYDTVRNVINAIRGSGEKYYYEYAHILWKANEYRIPEKYRKLYHSIEKNESKGFEKRHIESLTDFIKIDMYEYINKGYIGSYNPFWIFGSKHYKENIDYIRQEKQKIEFYTLQILYTDLNKKVKIKTPIMSDYIKLS